MKLIKLDDEIHPHKGYVVERANGWLREGWVVWLERTDRDWWRVCKGVIEHDTY